MFNWFANIVIMLWGICSVLGCFGGLFVFVLVVWCLFTQAGKRWFREVSRLGQYEDRCSQCAGEKECPAVDTFVAFPCSHFDPEPHTCKNCSVELTCANLFAGQLPGVCAHWEEKDKP